VEDPERGVRLVRGLVLREAHVAVDPEEGALRWRHELRREPREADVELIGEQPQGSEHRALVRGALLLEPGFGVVPLEPLEEGERLGLEPGECAHDRLS
jgi:hypothetical protein